MFKINILLCNFYCNVFNIFALKHYIHSLILKYSIYTNFLRFGTHFSIVLFHLQPQPKILATFMIFSHYLHILPSNLAIYGVSVYWEGKGRLSEK